MGSLKESWDLAYRKYLAEKHLDFKGVSISGHLDNFKSELEKIGYRCEYSNDNHTRMSGEYAGRKVNLSILITSMTKLVYLLLIDIKEDDWQKSKEIYNSIRDQLSEKYGQPSEVIEEFEEPYEDGDGYEFDALEMGQGSYFSNYHLPQGRICVAINCHAVENEDTGEITYDKGVFLSYFDNNNMRLSHLEDEIKSE